jgi:hypothetical protein
MDFVMPLERFEVGEHLHLRRERSADFVLDERGCLVRAGDEDVLRKEEVDLHKETVAGVPVAEAVKCDMMPGSFPP